MDFPESYKPKHHVRFVTATSLFDGHDVAINIMRRILQDSGAEVIHLGHNRSASEIVDAAIQEDAHAIAVSSYQGGHVEFFRFIVELLKERGAEDIRVFGGGGGVIVPAEIREIEAMGVAKIFSPEDGRTLGLQGIINRMLETVDRPLNTDELPQRAPQLTTSNSLLISRYITGIEEAKAKQNGRHRRRREIIARRRTRHALSQRFRRQDGRDSVRRSHAAQVRRRTARRPHPHELPAPGSRLHAFAGHARFER